MGAPSLFSALYNGRQATNSGEFNLARNAACHPSLYNHVMNGRPQLNEAAPYYFTYIDQVAGENALVLMESQLDKCLQLLSTVSESKSLYRYAAGKWSLRQVLNHVSDTERSLAFRALWFARGFEAPLPSYDQNVAAAGAQADATPGLPMWRNLSAYASRPFRSSRTFRLRAGCAPA